MCSCIKPGNVITKDEMDRIVMMQQELGMSEDHAKAIIELLRDRHIPK